MAVSTPKFNGYFGSFGGRFVPHSLESALEELEQAYYQHVQDPSFAEELDYYLAQYVGRPSPLYYAEKLSRHCGGAKIFLKREDLNHTGAHKINNTMGQALLAKRMGKTRVIAETGAGQHGVATATACALLGLECVIYQGAVDAERQALNVFRMELMGARVVKVTTGQQTLKDAVDAALRDYAQSSEATFYLLGSAVGPHPYPLMVRNFQSVIGLEARQQIIECEGQLPSALVACVGGGSNAIGLFHPFVNDRGVKMYGVEPAGKGLNTNEHAATLCKGEPGLVHGFKCYVLQDECGQTALTHSIAAGLDYPGVGPEHCFYHDTGRATYTSVTDKEALEAFLLLSRLEGIVPALESAHAISYALTLAPQFNSSQAIIVNLSGRGDKDVEQVAKTV